MNKIDNDAYSHYYSMLDSGIDGSDKDIEKEASWRALHDQMPKRPRADYRKERDHITDKRAAAKRYVKGNEFKNESKNINKKLIRLTESDLHRIVKESVKRIVKESVEEGTPKQNAFLQKLMGDRWKDEYANLSVKDSSAMIDKELASTNNENGPKYEVVEFDNKTSECNSFYEAKKKFKEVIDELDEAGFFRDPDLSMVRVSDVCYRLYGRNSRRCLGSVFIRKKA